MIVITITIITVTHHLTNLSLLVNKALMVTNMSMLLCSHYSTIAYLILKCVNTIFPKESLLQSVSEMPERHCG